MYVYRDHQRYRFTPGAWVKKEYLLSQCHCKAWNQFISISARLAVGKYCSDSCYKRHHADLTWSSYKQSTASPSHPVCYVPHHILLRSSLLQSNVSTTLRSLHSSLNLVIPEVFIMAGELLGGPGPSQATQSSSDLFSGFDMGASSTANGSSNQNHSATAPSSDMFGGLSLGSNSVSAPQGQATQQQSSGSDLQDLFSMTTQNPTPQGSSTGADLLAGLSLGKTVSVT